MLKEELLDAVQPAKIIMLDTLNRIVTKSGEICSFDPATEEEMYEVEKVRKYIVHRAIAPLRILHFTFYILHFTFYILHFTFYILHFTFYILHFYILHFTFYILHFTFYILHFYIFTFYILQFTFYILQFTFYILHFTLYIVYCILYIVYCTLYIVYCMLYVVYCILYIVLYDDTYNESLLMSLSKQILLIFWQWKYHSTVRVSLQLRRQPSW